MIYKTKVDIIYEKLLRDIESCHYAPGEHLVISQISRDNNVSDIPVREAIRRLESEGYVTMSANQGATVCNFTPALITEIFEIKAVLEGFASRLAVDVLTESDFLRLNEINDKMLSSYKKGDLKGCAEYNKQFHMYIYKQIPQRELCNMIDDLWKKYSVTRKVFQKDPGHPTNSYKDHQEILELMRNKQYNELELFVRKHKVRAGKQLVENINN